MDHCLFQRRVNKTFPSPIGMKTKDFTEKVLKHRKRPELALPVDKVHNMLKTEVLHNAKLDIEVSRYQSSISENKCGELLTINDNFIYLNSR